MTCVEDLKSLRVPYTEELAAFEAFLGDCETPGNVFGFKHIVEEDEAELSPMAGIEALNGWGLQSYYLPESEGGNFRNAEEFLMLMRLLSRRDLTLAIGHGKTFLGVLPVWIGGSDAQKEVIADYVRRGDRVSLGLTEQAHGSDLSANELVALPTGDESYVLNGTKWSINNINGEHILLLCKTANVHAVRNYSLFFLDKRAYDEGKMECGKLRPVGLRGADLGFIRLDELEVDADVLVGGFGRGIDQTVKTLQITRFMCNAFSLGAFDTAFRVSLRFLMDRKLYGNFAINIPVVRQQVIDIAADALLCDFFSTVGARMLHVLPREFGLLSAVSKSTVPVVIDACIYQLSLLMGARSLFRNDYADGVFQKVKRDHAIIPIFDGNTAVNRQFVIGKLRPLAQQKGACYEEYETLSRAIFDLDSSLDSLDISQLTLLSKNCCFLKQAFWESKEALKEKRSVSRTDELIYQGYVNLMNHWEDLDWSVLQDEEAQLLSTYSIPADYFDYARRLGLLHLGAACIGIWLHNKEAMGSVVFTKAWIVLCLNQLLKQLGDTSLNKETIYLQEEAIGNLGQLLDDKQLISFLPFTIH